MKAIDSFSMSPLPTGPNDIERLRDQVWNWLPAFHAVAELGTLVQAGRHLGLTPAAVSRTVRLLEDRLNQPLFDRMGRALVLNDAGTRLREATRVAISTLDQGLAALDPAKLPRRLRAASLGLLSEHFVVPALIGLSQAHTDLLPEHLNARPSEALTRLRRFEIDVAFYYEELAADGIDVSRLGLTPKAVFCGSGHPLFPHPHPTLSDVLEYPFSVPQIGDSGAPMDGWPSDLSRSIGMRVTLLRSNLQVSLSGRFLTVLPEVTAAPHVDSGELRRLPEPVLEPIAIYVAMRQGESDRVDVARLVAAVREGLIP